jgi:hypothetical protein
MATYVDRRYFRDLATASPTTVCRGDRCRCDPSTTSYTLRLWGDEYRLDWTAETIERTPTTSAPVHDYFHLFIIYYLLLPKDMTVRGEWVSEKDLPGGTTFFRGPHLLPTNLISDRFGNDLASFSASCLALGGTPLKMADAAFGFQITPDMPVAVLYWAGDEDFPAEAKILYDRGVIEALPLDIVFALAVEVCARIGGAGRGR